MARYSVDTVGLQVGLQRVGAEGAVLAEQVPQWNAGPVSPAWGTHPDVDRVTAAWNSFVMEGATASTRLNGAVQRKAGAVIDAATIVDAGDAQMSERAHRAASRINDNWGAL